MPFTNLLQESPIESPRPRRIVRVLRDSPYRDDDNVYYIESESPRRTAVARKPPTEYIYVDETPAPIRHYRSPRSEIVYVDEERPNEYDDEYIYVDENGNEIDFIDEYDYPPRYVEYAYDNDDKYRRRSQKPKVIYVEDEPPINQRRSRSKPKQPSSTRVVYQ